MIPHLRTLAASQSGAIFGLDARIALAIFGVISVVAGVAIVVNMDSVRGKSLAQELNETGQAVESLVTDLNTDLFPALTQPSEKNAFTALFDNSVLTEEGNLRSRWLGPYIKFTSTEHPRYSTMVLQPRQADHTVLCSPGSDCYLWIVYSNVKLNIAEEANNIIDNPNEQNPSANGRLQWTADRDSAALYFRAAKTISYTGD